MYHRSYTAMCCITTFRSTTDCIYDGGPIRLQYYNTIVYILITNLMHWLLFIHKILFSSTCFKPQVFIFRRIQLYTCSIWYCHSSWWPVGTQLEFSLIFRRIQLYTCSICYCHSLREFVVAYRYTAWVLNQAVYRQATTNSRREWQYHMLHVYNCILLKVNT